MANLLKNSGFEGVYRAWNGIAEISIAEGWLPFWVERRPGDEEWKNRRPVYRAAPRAVDPNRVRSGQLAQAYFTSWATHTAGLMQQADVTPGQSVRFSAYGHAWSTNEDSPDKSVDPGIVRMKIGIDPTGGVTPFGPNVVWSTEKTVYDRYDDGFTVEATAQNTTVTVFLLSAPEWPKKHNDVYWDDASMSVVGGLAVPLPIPAERDAMLVLESETRQIGKPVLVYVTSTRALTNVHLNVSGPTGPLDTTWLGLGSGGRGNMWRWEFTPRSEGPYTATFSADGVESVSGTINIIGLVKPPPPSVGAPVAAPARGWPRTQYERTYVLLPQTADERWLRAILDSGVPVERKWTIGFSADDAGIGDLDVRNVIVVNPAAWPEPIVPWFALWYPGVNVRTIEASTPNQLRIALSKL